MSVTRLQEWPKSVKPEDLEPVDDVEPQDDDTEQPAAKKKAAKTAGKKPKK